jgi:nucleoside-diphosphate-sugar epimerase
MEINALPNEKIETVLVTGGAGYVGSALVPKLLAAGYRVKVLDLFLYGKHVLEGREVGGRKSEVGGRSGDPDLLATHHSPLSTSLELITGDIRDQRLLKRSLAGCDAVIHLACISNDPSFELNPELGKSINYDAFRPLVQIAKDGGVKRFIYASSSSVYGVKQEERVTEELALEPLTDYSKYKAICEEVLAEFQSPDFTTVTLRPATVCGYAPRLRLDLTVNILTNHAVTNRRIRVFGGEQYRPNLHIGDMTDLYLLLLTLPKEKIAGKIWNAGYHNLKVMEVAELVREVVGEQVEIAIEPTDDHRSYRVTSDKIAREIGFVPRRSVRDAILDLKAAFDAGRIPDSMTGELYYNIRRMQSVKLT